MKEKYSNFILGCGGFRLIKWNLIKGFSEQVSNLKMTDIYPSLWSSLFSGNDRNNKQANTYTIT